ncbi:hypothetical protein WN48_01097 [Eufriesea mexicana]|nr:hypothetical protein WN48_01097 [Eufriesea mexicana]
MEKELTVRRETIKEPDPSVLKRFEFAMPKDAHVGQDSSSPKTNQTGARLTNQRHPSATDAQLVRAARTVDADAVDADG